MRKMPGPRSEPWGTPEKIPELVAMATPGISDLWTVVFWLTELRSMFPVCDHWMDLFWDQLLILPAAYQSAPWCGSTDPGSALRGSPPGRWCLVGTPQQQPWEEGAQPSWRGGGSCLSADEAHLCCSYMSSPTLHRHSLTPLCFLPFHHWIFPGISRLMSLLLPRPPFSFKIFIHYFIFSFFLSLILFSLGR